MGRPKKIKTPGTINDQNDNEGLKKLQNLKNTLPPTPDPAAPDQNVDIVPPVMIEKKPVSGIFRSIYPLLIDLICHVLNKEQFTESRKRELLESIGEDLDEVERKYIPETVASQPGAKALSITGLAIAFQPKAKKHDEKPEKQPDQPKVPDYKQENAVTIPAPPPDINNAQ